MSQRTQCCEKLNIWIIQNILFWKVMASLYVVGILIMNCNRMLHKVTKTNYFWQHPCCSLIPFLRQSPSYLRSQRSSCGWTPPSPFLPPSKRSSPGDRDKDRDGDGTGTGTGTGTPPLPFLPPLKSSPTTCNLTFGLIFSLIVFDLRVNHSNADVSVWNIGKNAW